jgi:hypothetical protein
MFLQVTSSAWWILAPSAQKIRSVWAQGAVLSASTWGDPSRLAAKVIIYCSLVGCGIRDKCKALLLMCLPTAYPSISSVMLCRSKLKKSDIILKAGLKEVLDLAIIEKLKKS